MTDQVIQPKKQYFGAIPHIADDDLDVYQYRLYGHYIRVATNGQCNEKTKTTADRTRMSERQVRIIRQELCEMGYVSLEHTVDGKGDPGPVIVTLNDIEEENVIWCKHYKCTPSETWGTVQGAGGVLHHMQEGTASHAGKKNTLIEEEPIEESLGSSGDSPLLTPAGASKTEGKGETEVNGSQQSLFALPDETDPPVESPKKRKAKEPKKVARLFTTEVKNELLPVFFRYSFGILNYAAMTPAEVTQKMKRFGPALSALQPLDDEQNITAQELTAAYAHFHKAHKDASYPAGADTLPDMLITYRASKRTPPMAQSHYESVPYQSNVHDVRPGFKRVIPKGTSDAGHA